MLAQPAQREDGHHARGQRLVAGGQHVAAVDRNLDQDLILLEVGPFQVQPHAIGKTDRADAQPGLHRVADHLARHPEIGVAKAARRLALQRPDLRGHGFGPGRF